VGELQPLPPSRVKGKERPINASRIVALSRRRSHARTPFVGRDRQIDALGRARRDALEDGAPVLVTVLGEPGIGKSRVLDAFLASVDGATILRASVPSVGEGSSMAAIADLLRAAGGAADLGEAVSAIERRLRGREDAETLSRWLRSWVGTEDMETIESGWALRRLLGVLAEERPVVVAIDDLHWARPSLLDLIDDVVSWTKGAVLFLTAARPDLLDVRPTWAGGKTRALTITLGPLPDEHARAIAGALLSRGDGATETVIRSAEGNPLFLVQLAIDAEEQGEAWDPAATPSTIRALLGSRLDRLDPAIVRVAQIAAVQGTRFEADTVRALDPDLDDPTAALHTLERAHMIEEAGSGRWRFTHALIRETAYERLPKRVRAAYHRSLAGLVAARDDELAGVHLERAASLMAEIGEPDPALEAAAGERLARAGSQAFAGMDLGTASDLFERAAGLLPATSATRQDIVPDLAIALMETGRDAEAGAVLDRALEAATSDGSRARVRLQQLAMHVFLRSPIDQVRKGIEEASALTAVLERLGDDVGLAQGFTVLEYLHFLAGEHALAADACLRAVEHAVRAGRTREQIQAGGDHIDYLIMGSRSVGDLAARGADLERSPALVLRVGGAAVAAAAAGLAGDLDAYDACEARWLTSSEAQGLEWPVSMQSASMAVISLEMGHPERAESLVRGAIATMERLGDVWAAETLRLILPIAIARQGRRDEAATLAESLAELQPPMDPLGRSLLAVGLAESAAFRGRRDEARRQAEVAVETAFGTDWVLARTLALETSAAVLREEHPQDARHALTRALALHREIGNVMGAARVEAALGS
jgi:hypothetical protein